MSRLSKDGTEITFWLNHEQFTVVAMCTPVIARSYARALETAGDLGPLHNHCAEGGGIGPGALVARFLVAPGRVEAVGGPSSSFRVGTPPPPL